MSIAVVVSAMARAGCSAEQIAAVVEDFAAADAAAREERCAKNRASNAERQRRYRNAHNAVTQRDNALSGVTDRDTSSSSPSPVSPRDNNSTPSTPTTSPSPSSLRSDNASAREAFDRFWAVWPNKVGRPTAEKSFAKVHREIEAILAGVQSYIREKPPDRSWLNPATFLNQRRWEDAPATLTLESSNVQRTQHHNGHLRGHDALLAGIAKAAKVFDGDGPMAGRADEEIPLGRTNIDG